MAEVAISVVIPVYNESPNVQVQAVEIAGALDEYPGGFEVLFVDDGSTDDTAKKVEQASAENPCIKLIKLPENKGQVPAMVEGINRAAGEVIVTIDGDCQHDPLDIPAMVDGVKAGKDMICGWRKDRQDPYLGKRLPSKIFNFVLRFLFGVPIHDASCTLRAYRPEAIRSISLYKNSISFIPILAARAGYSVGEMVIRHRPRAAGEAKYDSPRRFVYTIRELIAIRLGKRDHVLPERP